MNKRIEYVRGVLRFYKQVSLAIDSLPVQEREVMLLHIEGKARREIYEALGKKINLNRIRSIVERAEGRLADSLLPPIAPTDTTDDAR